MPARAQLDRAAVAERLGIRPNSVSRLRERNALPEPDGVIGGSPWWWSTTIDAVIRERETRTARVERGGKVANDQFRYLATKTTRPAQVRRHLGTGCLALPAEAARSEATPEQMREVPRCRQCELRLHAAALKFLDAVEAASPL